MKKSTSRKIKSLSLYSIPRILFILFSLFSLLPNKLENLENFYPLTDVIFIYYWHIIAKSVIAPSLIFFVGIIYDLFLGQAVGMTAFSNLFISMLFIYYAQKLFSNNRFIELFLGFCIFVFLILLIKSIILYFYHDSFKVFSIFFTQFFYTILLYPIMHYIFIMIHRFIISKLEE